MVVYKQGLKQSLSPTVIARNLTEKAVSIHHRPERVTAFQSADHHRHHETNGSGNTRNWNWANALSLSDTFFLFFAYVVSAWWQQSFECIHGSNKRNFRRVSNERSQSECVSGQSQMRAWEKEFQSQSEAVKLKAGLSHHSLKMSNGRKPCLQTLWIPLHSMVKLSKPI